MPEWVDPDPDPRGDPDDGGGHPRHEPSEAPRPAVSGLDELAEKPVLEWSNEDWALWIDSADGSPLPTSPPAGGTSEGKPAAGGEPDGEPAGDVKAAPDDGDRAAGESGGETEPEAEPLMAEPEAEPATAEAADEAADVLVTDVLVTDEAAGEAADVLVTDVLVTDEAEGEDEWASIADHPWWESAPAVDEANDFDTDPPTTAEPAAEVSPPVEVTPPQKYPSPPVHSSPRAGPATRPIRPIPAPRIERAVPRPQVAAPVPSHRVRSAFGLLGVAVMVGMVVAGLITVAIFAISVALRHAVS